MSFYENNGYFSILGLHYFVGYGAGAAALEAWAIAHPLRVIAQVYVDSPGLGAQYLESYASREFGSETAEGYSPVEFPRGFDLIRYDATVVPTSSAVRNAQRQEEPSVVAFTPANPSGHTGVGDVSGHSQVEAR